MKRIEIWNSLSVKKQLSSVYRNSVMLLLALTALLCGYFFKDKLGLGMLILSSCLTAMFFILDVLAFWPIAKELILAKTYIIYPGKVIETQTDNIRRKVFFVIEYEDPKVCRGETDSCFFPLDGTMLLGKKLRIGKSPKSKKLIVIP